MLSVLAKADHVHVIVSCYDLLGSHEQHYADAALQSEVTAFAEECERDLAAAEPVIKEAEAALNSLDKGSLGELKSFGSPAAEVVQVVSACIVLTAPGGKIPKVNSSADVDQCHVQCSQPALSTAVNVRLYAVDLCADKPSQDPLMQIVMQWQQQIDFASPVMFAATHSCCESLVMLLHLSAWQLVSIAESAVSQCLC